MTTFRRAIRESVGLIIGLAGPSGSGKTYSALRLASGLADGKPIALIDTEAGRARHYADMFAFDHADLKPPFRPEAYSDAIRAADDAHYPIIVVDSCSHEHAGEGGLLDWHEEEMQRMAGEDAKRRDVFRMAAWVAPKVAHKKFVQRLLQVRAHLILCFRAEEKIEMVKDAKTGKLEVMPKRGTGGFSGWIPVAEKSMLYEMTCSLLLTPERPGVPIPIKLQQQHRAMVSLDSELTEDVGRRLGEWARGTGAWPSPTTSEAENERRQLIANIKVLANTGKLTPAERQTAAVTYLGKGVTMDQADLSALSDLRQWLETRVGGAA